MFVSAILLAAGKGLRLKSRVSKPLIEINSVPLIVYSLKALSNHPSVREIIIAVNPGNFRDIIRQLKRFKIKKVSKIVEGGLRRQDSVRNALNSLDACADLVLIHDSARPFVSTKIITAVIKEAGRCGAAVTGVPVKSTIKEGHKLQVPPLNPWRAVTSHKKTVIKKTIDRNNLWEVQTPQVFRRGFIEEGFKKFGHQDVTDDAMLAEKLGRKVSIVMGSYSNIKITTPEDLIIAEAVAKSKKY